MAINLTPDEQTAAMDAASSDLKFLMSKENVSVLNQAKLYHIGVKTIQLFTTFVEDVKDLRAMLKTNLELDPATRLGDRIQVAAITCAFQSASV